MSRTRITSRLRLAFQPKFILSLFVTNSCSGKNGGCMGLIVLVIWRLKVNAKIWSHFHRRSCCPEISILFESVDLWISNILTAWGFNTFPHLKDWILAAATNSSPCQKMVFHPPYLFFPSRSALC